MGRYYNGDIEGKFWFAVQSSTDADHFGVVGSEPSEVNYYFDESNLPDIKKGIKKCVDELGEYKVKLDTIFDKVGGYSNEMIAKELGIGIENIGKLLENYARLELGEKILKCVETTGQCDFDAEL